MYRCRDNILTSLFSGFSCLILFVDLAVADFHRVMIARTTVTVPDGLLPGQRIHVNFENENNQTMTLAAIIPPNINPGDQFYVTLPWTNDDDKVSLNESIIANDYCDDLHLDVEKQAVQIMHQRNESLVAYEALPLSQSSIPAKEIV